MEVGKENVEALVLSQRSLLTQKLNLLFLGWGEGV